MFQWLTELVSPHYDVDEFIEAFAPGHKHSLARLDQRRKEEDKQRHEEEVRALQKERLEQELEDAEWILRYEKRLISLEKKTTQQRSQAEQLGANTERLRKLEYHLAGLRRNLSLD